MKIKIEKEKLFKVTIAIIGIVFVAKGLEYIWFYGVQDNFPRYKFLFSHLDENTQRFRFAFSLVLRAAMILIGVGLILRKNFFRKMAILYSVFTILTVYWKHPLATFRTIYRTQAIHGSLDPTLIRHVDTLALISTILNCALDVACCVFMISFFMRSDVKGYFKPKSYISST